MNNNSREELYEYILKNSPHVNANIVEDWLDNTIKVVTEDVDDMEDCELISNSKREELIKKRVMFHIKRLNGIGGSDMAALLMDYRGEFHPFTTAEDVVRSKLCMNTPERFTGDTERGTVMEPIIEGKFLRAMRHLNLKVFHEGLEKLNKFEANGGSEEHPWIKSSPDGLYIDKNNEVWLVDYKCPFAQSTVMDNYEDPALYYRAQIAQYKIHLEMAGVKIHHTVLAPFSMKEMRIYIAEFTVDDKLKDDILKAGDHYWGSILRNELPRRPPSSDFSHISEVPPQLKRAMVSMIMSKKMESISKARSEKLKENFLELATICGVDWNVMGRKTRLPGMDIRNSFVEYTDTAALKEKLRTFGIDPEDKEFKKERSQITIATIRSKNSEYKDMIDEVHEIATRAFSDANDDVDDSIDYEIPGSDVTDPTEIQEYGRSKKYENKDLVPSF